MLLRLDGVGRSVGARVLFSDVSLAVYAGDRIGIVGPNGAGKTTLLHIAAGDEPPDAGRVSSGRDVRVGMLRQEIDPRRGTSVREEVASVLGHLDELEREMRAARGRDGALRARGPGGLRGARPPLRPRARGVRVRRRLRARGARRARARRPGLRRARARPAARELQRRLADARRAREAAALGARRAAARRAHQPSRSALDRSGSRRRSRSSGARR